jgi:hypothetical protein
MDFIPFYDQSKQRHEQIVTDDHFSSSDSMLPCSCFRKSLASILCSLTFPYLYPTRVRSVLKYLMTLSCSSSRSSLGSRFFRLYPCEIASHDRRLGVLSLVVCLNAWFCVNAWFGSLIECNVLWVDYHNDIGLVKVCLVGVNLCLNHPFILHIPNPLLNLYSSTLQSILLQICSRQPSTQQ